MRRRVWSDSLRAPQAARTRSSRGSGSPTRSISPSVSLSPAYLWRHLPLLSARCCSHAAPIALFSTRGAAEPDRIVLPAARIARNPIARDRLTYLRKLSDEQSVKLAVKWVDFYRRAIARLPSEDALIDTEAQYGRDALQQLSYSDRVTPLDYCVLIFHLLRVDAKELAASLINEMTNRRLSVRAAIRALLAHHLIVAGRPYKAREILAPNVGGGDTNYFVYDTRERVTEHMQPIVLPVDVAILLMAPDDSPFFRSPLFHQLTFKQRQEAAARGPVTPLDSVVQCFDFLRSGGYLARDVACYHYVMQRLAEAGQTAECRRVFRDMTIDGVAPTGESYLALMQSMLTEQHGVARLNDLIRLKAQSAPDVSDAAAAASVPEVRRRQVLKLQLLILHSEMLQRRVAVPAPLYSILIQWCCLADDVRRALQLVQEMRVNGHCCPLHVVHALLSLPSLPPRAVRDIVEMVEVVGAGMPTFRCFAESAIRRRSVADVTQFVAETTAGQWTWPRELRAAEPEKRQKALVLMHCTVIGMCSSAGLEQVALQLLDDLLQAARLSGYEQHHDLLQLLCDKGGVSVAAMHLQQMSAAFGVLPRPRDFYLVMTAALQLPASDGRTRLLEETARNKHFASLFLEVRADGQRCVALSRCLTDSDALDTVRALLLWLSYVGRRFVLHAGLRGVQEKDGDTVCALQLLATDEQHRSGLCERVKALVDKAAGSTPAHPLAWRLWEQSAGLIVWELPLLTTHVRKIRGRVRLEAVMRSAKEKRLGQQTESDRQSDSVLESADDNQAPSDEKHTAEPFAQRRVLQRVGT